MPPCFVFRVLPGGLEKRILFPWDWGGSAIDDDYDAECCAGRPEQTAWMDTPRPLGLRRYYAGGSRQDAMMDDELPESTISWGHVRARGRADRCARIDIAGLTGTI